MLLRSRAYRFSMMLILSIFYFIFYQYYQILDKNEVHWNEQIIAPYFGNVHFFLLIICPALNYLIGRGWGAPSSKMFFDMLRVGQVARVLILFLSNIAQLLIIFLFLSPVVLLLKLAGFESWNYFSLLLGGTFLVGISLVSISIYVGLNTTNIFFYLFLNLFVFSFFYLIGLFAKYSDHFIVIDFFRHMSFSVQYDNFVAGFISLESVTYFLSIVAVFLYLSVIKLQGKRRSAS